jgi:hypothetical protein
MKVWKDTISMPALVFEEVEVGCVVLLPRIA